MTVSAGERLASSTGRKIFPFKKICLDARSWTDSKRVRT